MLHCLLASSGGFDISDVRFIGRAQTFSSGSWTKALCLHLVRTIGSTCFLSKLRLFGASNSSWGGEWLYCRREKGGITPHFIFTMRLY